MIFLVLIEGQIWRLREDGSLQLLSGDEWEALQASGQEYQIVGSGGGVEADVASATSLAEFFAGVERIGPEILPESGFTTGQFNDRNDITAFEPEGQRLPPPIGQDAQITVTIEDNGDGFVNLAEVSTVDVSGTTLEMVNGQAIFIVITDSLGNRLDFMTTVDDGVYALQDLDLSALAQGPLSVTATARDIYGNALPASDDSVIDTLATIGGSVIVDDNNMDGTGDDDGVRPVWDGGSNGQFVINQNEDASLRVDGTTTFIDAGQTITLVFADGSGNSVTATTTISAGVNFSTDEGGSYFVENVDVSSLGDGVITVTATSTDVPGNIAQQTFTLLKDTSAEVTLQFDGDKQYSTTEIAAVTLSGNVVGIEPGRSITIDVSDGVTTVTTVAIVQPGGNYQTAPLDLSTFNDGVAGIDGLTAITREVSDLAGNVALAASDTATKDTMASIDILTPPGGLDIDDLRSGQIVTIEGATANVEPGQMVSVTFTDTFGATETFTASLQADGSWDTDVSVVGLNGLVPWTLTTTVSDLAGNLVTDATPTLIEPTSVVLSEDALVRFTTGFAQDSSIRISGFDDFEFSTDQSPLESLSSVGVPVSVSVAVDGLSLTVDAAGNPVLAAVYNNDGTVTVTLFAPIDQASGSNATSTVINIEVTQNDADITVETLSGRIPVMITESDSFTEDDAYDAVEQVPTSGNVFVNDNLLEGPLTLIEIDVEGTRYAIDALNPSVINTSKGELTVFANGNWGFVGARNLDNSVVQTLTFTYSALDQDSDFDFSDVMITISDGAAGNVPSAIIEVSEPIYGTGMVGMVPFTVVAGSDDLVASSIEFSPEQLSALSALSLTASGVTVVFSLANGNQTLLASAGGNPVFEVDLSATLEAGTGNLLSTGGFTQYLPLDHLVADSLYIPLNVQATDIDGTIASATSTLIIDDGADPSSSADAGVISEDALALIGGAILPGSLSVTIGSDTVTDIGFLNSGQPAATSGGVSLQYQVSADGLTLTAYTVDPMDPVFTAVISAEPVETSDSALGYTFTLFKALDQLDAFGNPVAALDLDLRFQVSDFEMDQTEAVIPVSVTDGSSATGGDVALQLSELPKKLANLFEPDSAEVDFSLSASFDPIVSAGFDMISGANVLDSSGNVVTQNGVALVWVYLSPTTLQAQTPGGVNVLSFELPENLFVAPGDPATVPLKASVLAQIDHLDAGLSTDNLTIPIAVNFVDSDGTATRLNADISIFDGRDPTGLIATPLTVDEDDIAGVSANDSGLASSLPGADDYRSSNVTLDSAITSNGVAVVLAGAPDSSGWWIASAGADEVFRFQIDLNGATEVRFSKPIDHSPAADNGENTQAINLGISVNDADGDSSTVSTQVINIIDDVPVDKDRSIKLTEGTNKSINVLNNGEGGADGAEITEVHYFNSSSGMLETYLIAPGGSTSFDLYSVTAIVYGSATVNSNGRVVVQTAVSQNSTFSDAFDFTVTDVDGDVEVNTITLDVFDEEAVIEISPLSADEDTPLVLTLTANPGDIDQNDEIIAISFDNSALSNGTLLLNGTALPLDGSGNPVLTLAGGGLIVTDALTGSVAPNGVLTFLPALNSSDTTDTVRFDVAVSVDGDTGVRTHNDSFNVSVAPIVDLPIWDATSVFTYTMSEDGASPAFALTASLEDDDGSEALSYRIENIDAGITLKSGSSAIGDGDILTPAEFAALAVELDENLSGEFVFDAVAISEEMDTGDQAEALQTVTIDVTPEADVPTVSTSNVFMLEDELVELSSFLSGGLSDNDGSESLFFDLQLPGGWMITNAMGIETGLVSPGTYRVADADVQAGLVFLKPLEDISSAIAGNFQLTVTAVAVESSVDGIGPSLQENSSPPRTVRVEVEGVVDNPAVGAGPDAAWNFSGATISGAFDEDSLIPLNFTTGTEDDDQSEVFDFTLQGLPDGVSIVDSSGAQVNLDVAGVDGSNQPIYSVSSVQLATLFVKPAQDFSGQILMQLNQTNTEPDGDSASFNLAIDITVNPVVDSSNGINDTSTIVEDTPGQLLFNPALADIDGSETLTNATISSLPAGVSVLLDLAPVSIPPGGLDLAQLATDNGTDFDTLISSGRLTVQAPQDSDVNFSLPTVFEITDTSPLGSMAITTVTGDLQVTVSAQVDDTTADGITRIETSGSVTSTDGSAISLSGAAQFAEADIDGSEYLDYISISIPETDGWFVTHPNGAINDGNGNWLIPATGLTSASSVDAMAELLAGATIVSDHVATVDITIKARVLDGNNDADIIQNTLSVEFQVAGAGGAATAIGILQTSDADGFEQSTVDLSAHIDTLASGDANDVESYRIDVADMPQGGRVTGSDVIVEYANDGSTVRSYLFTGASLPSLSIAGIQEDFAGVLSILVHKISTDPGGNTIVTTEPLDIQLQPVVDTLDAPPIFSILEDVPTPMDFDPNILLNDADVAITSGVETILAIRFLPLAAGSITDPADILIDNGDGSFTLTDISRLNEIYYNPPLNQHGSASFDLELTVQDQTSGIDLVALSNTVTEVVPVTVNFEITAVTDPAPVVALDSTGVEDSDIALNSLFVVDIDNDGSETLTMQLSGVPAGGVLYWNNGGSLEQLKNNGSDGSGGFVWTFSRDQIDDLVLRPPRDFSGDIPLTLQSTSMELSTQSVVVETTTFTVGVLPDADGASFFKGPEDVTSVEGTPVTIGVYAETNEALNPDETLVVSVTVKSGSDSTATLGLVGIQAPDGSFSAFIDSGVRKIATLQLSQDQLDELTLIVGDDAFGDLEIDIAVGSTDSAQVLGNSETDTSATSEFQVKSIVVSLTPEPDPPIIELRSQEIHSGVAEVPLGLSLTEINPAPGENSQIVVSGVPDGILLSGGMLSGTLWVVDSADVETLSILNAAPGATYNLSIEPRSTLDGDTVAGGELSLNVTMDATLGGINTLSGSALQTNLLLGGDGSDSLSGGLLEDTYLFRLADIGPAGSPVQDVISNFDAGTTRLDKIDLSDIAAGRNDGASLDAIIDIDGIINTTLTIDLGAGDVQSIELTGVTREDLFGAPGLQSDADILQKMLDHEILLTG